MLVKASKQISTLPTHLYARGNSFNIYIFRTINRVILGDNCNITINMRQKSLAIFCQIECLIYLKITDPMATIKGAEFTHGKPNAIVIKYQT